MSEETMPSELRLRTHRAVETWAGDRRPESQRSDTPVPISPGQLLLLSEIVEPRVAWAVLRRDAKDGDAVLLVPVDTNPLVGSGDVAVTVPALGALSLRCGLASWRHERHLGTFRVLGSLLLTDLSRADSRWQALTAGHPVGSLSEQERDADPEYQDWIEGVVRPAHERLSASPDAAALETPPPAPLPRPTTPGPAPLPSWARWAAVLAFLGLGLASGLFWWRQSRQIEKLRVAAEQLESEHRLAITGLEAERAALESRYRERLAAAGADRERLIAEHQAQVEALETRIGALRRATDLRNPVFAALDSDDVVRGWAEVEVGPEASHVVLQIVVHDPEGTHFRIVVLDRRSGSEVFTATGLRADALGTVSLGVPAGLLPPAVYRVRVERQDGETWHFVEEHRLEVEPHRRSSRRW